MAATRRPRRYRAEKPPATRTYSHLALPRLGPGVRFDPSPRRYPQQRAHATWKRLLAAARTEFSARNYDAVQTTDIASRAGVSVGSFYRYFKDKREIFIEMITWHLRAVHEAVLVELEPAKLAAKRDRSQVIDHALDALLDGIRASPELFRAFHEMSLRDPEVAELRARFEGLGETMIASLVEVLVPPGDIPDARAAAHVIVLAAQEVTLSRAGLRGAHDHPSDDAAVKRALADMIRRFVFPNG